MKKEFNRLIFKLTSPLVIIMLVSFLVLIPVTVKIVKSVIEDQINQNLNSIAILTQSYITEEVHNLQNKLKLLIDLRHIETALRKKDSEALRNLLLPAKFSLGVNFIAAFDHEKEPIVVFHDKYVSRTEMLSLKEIDKGVLGVNFHTITSLKNGLYAIGVVSGSTREKPNIIIAGKRIENSFLNKAKKVKQIEGDYDIFLYDTIGNIVTGTGDEVGIHKMVPDKIFDLLSSNRKGLISKIYHHPGNVSDALIFSSLVFDNATRAFFGIHIPVTGMIAMKDNVIKTIIIIMSAGIFLMLLTGYITSRYISKRIENILDGTDRITEGELGYQISDNSKDEIGVLAESFNTMSTNLLESQNWWSRTFDAMSDAVSIHDMQGNIIKAIRALEKLLRLKMGEIIGRKCYQIFHGTDSHINDCPKAQSNLFRDSRRLETFEPHFDRYLSISISPIFSPDREVEKVVHITRDITKQKNAERLITQQFNQLDVLHSIEKAVNSSLDIRSTLEQLVGEVTARVNVDAAAVLLLNEHNQRLEYNIGCGFRTNVLKYTRLKLGEGNAGRAAIEKRIVSIPDLKKDPSGFTRSEHFRSEGFVAYIAVPLITKSKIQGVLELFSRSYIDISEERLIFLETIAVQASNAIEKSMLYDKLQHSRDEIMIAYDSTIMGWSHAMDMRDRETEGHSRRVTDITLKIAKRMGVEEKELGYIKWGALLHDIGKIGVPDNILLKPDKLTSDEWQIMKRHTEYALNMLKKIEYLRPSIDIPYCHHEKWDGTGYPRGLKEKDIPLAARIFAVADVWDALCSDRPYRPAWPLEKVIEHIQSLSGTHFDPEVVKIFLQMLSIKPEVFQKDLSEVPLVNLPGYNT